MTPEDVHRASVPNDLALDALRVRPDERGKVSVDPRSAHWRYLTFRRERVRADAPLDVGGEGSETIVVVLGGGGVSARAGGRTFELEGRQDPFAGLPWALYVPAGAVRLEPGASDAAGAPAVDVGVGSAPRSRRTGVADAPILITPDDVAVEIRGAGNATRQITHIVAPEFPADRLLCVEVHTPSGNWSSWPPHKHDQDDMPREAVLEEIYCYAFRRPEAWAIQRLYRRPERGLPLRDGLWAVRGGDVVLVTDGYHPFAATHGDDAYYLNVLAGDRRTMACSFDPDLDWTRSTWSRMEPDPRVPLVPKRQIVGQRRDEART